MTEQELVKSTIDYAKKFIGIGYKWGGNNPFEGFDCSGFILWILRPVKLAPRWDMRAQDLYDRLKKRECDSVKPGCLIFYGRSKDKISHVAMAINDKQIIEAGGAGRDHELEDCKKTGACVRQRIYDYRKDLVAMVYPNYEGVINGN